MSKEEKKPLLDDSLIGVGCPNRSSFESIQVTPSMGFQSNKSWIVNDEDEDPQGEEEKSTINSTWYKAHPTYQVLGGRKKRKKQWISLPFLCACVLVLFLNITVLLIYPFNNDLILGGGTIQQWIVVIDVAAIELLLLWLIAKLIHMVALILVEHFFHPITEFFLYRWRMFEITLLGLSWGIVCGLTFKLFYEEYSPISITDQMVEVVHDLTIAVILLYSLIGLKVFIISTFESHLYKKFSALIGLSVREERDLVRIDKRLFRNPKEQLITRKFRELDIDPYMSGSPFRVKTTTTHRVSEKPDHVPIHVAAATFSQTLVEKCSAERDGFLRRDDFLKLGKGTSSRFVNDIFNFLDADNDGKISPADINLALRNMFKTRRQLRKSMRSRRVLLETTNTIINIVLLFAAIIIVLAYVLELDLSEYAVPFATLVLAFSFAYQNILQDVVDNLYTLFFVRPYNLGDMIQVDGERYFVEEVGLLSSACLHEDGYVAYIRNSLMREQPLLNLKRGTWIRLKLTCYILPSTTIQQVEEFKKQLTFFCVQSQIFSSKVNCYCDPTMNPGPSLNCRLKLKGYANWQDRSNWQSAQSKAVIAISNIAQELGILDTRNKLKVENQSVN